MITKSKPWDWNKDNNEIWYIPSEESYFLLHHWKERGFRTFLDLGCGRGRHAILFAENGFEVTAVDLSEVAINGLKEWAKDQMLDIKTAITDMNQLPFEENSFDCLLAYNVISHTDSMGIKKIIAEIKRVLKKEGEFYVTLCSKEMWSYKEAGFPKIDEHTVLRIEDGPENNVPHFFVDENSIKELFADFTIISLRHKQELILNEEEYVTWHYFVHGKKI